MGKGGPRTSAAPAAATGVSGLPIKNPAGLPFKPPPPPHILEPKAPPPRHTANPVGRGQAAPVTMPSPDTRAHLRLAAARFPTITMGERKSIARAAAALAAAADADRAQQIAYEKEAALILAHSNRAQAEEQARRDRAAHQQAASAIAPPPPAAWTLDSERYHVPESDPMVYWHLAADHSCWWYESEGWGVLHEYHAPTEAPQADATTAAATGAAAATAVPAEVHQIETAAIVAGDLYFAAVCQRAEAAAAGRQASWLSHAAVDTSAMAVQAAHTMTATMRHALSDTERVTILRTGELAAAAADQEIMQAAAQQNAQAAAVRRNPALAIEDAFLAEVGDGTFLTAATAQARHAAVQPVAAPREEGRDDAAAVPPTTAAATALTATTVITHRQQIFAARVSPFGMGQGGVASLTQTNERARGMAQRAADAAAAKAARDAATNERLYKSKRPGLRPHKKP